VGAPDAVLELVERFARNRDQYLNPAYNETQVRREFLDPFFTALGWDVDNTQGFAQQYKDVVHEDAIKVGLDSRAPDYSFRVGGQRKFFVEAKKPAVNLRDDPAPAFQLRRYAWSAKLPLSILTDFQEFAVYDCRVKPALSDKPSAARTLYVDFEQYGERWDEIAGVFGKAAIYQGSFDRYAESTKAKRGTAEVDKAFLGEIELWRDALAHNIALRNPALSQRELNYAVQVTIDRIIFLRICEDRGIEVYGRLRGLANGGGTYGRLTQLFWEADQRYNSGLFHFDDEKGRAGYADRLTPTLAIDDKVLKDIVKRLYYPESPYEFSVLPADILGQVYEQFLGKVIRLTAGHRAVVEGKPEVKKAGGVYYTPTYIVDYIVKHTVGRLLEGLTPKQAASLRILDPACGSGSFLIGAYQYLLDWHRDWYIADAQGSAKKHAKALYQGPGGEWRLTGAEKKRILLNNLYGVDIDAQAVETTKLSLLLKVLEGETSESLDAQLSFLRERALPDLAANIKCGNSLIGPDFYDDAQLGLAGLDDEERYRINVFDWEAEFPEILGQAVPEEKRGFDAVIGNPPYIQLSMAAYFDTDVSGYLASHYSSSAGRLNTYGLFIERVLRGLLREGGYHSFIVPNTLLTQEYYGELRRQILMERLRILVVFSEQVFAGAVVETTVFVIQHVAPLDGEVEVIEYENRSGASKRHSIRQSVYESTHCNAFLVRASGPMLTLKLRMDAGAALLGSIANINQAIALKGDRRASLVSEPTGPECKRVIDGRNIGRYSLTWSGDYLVYDVERIHSCKRTDIFETPEKLFFRRVGDRIIATLDDERFYALNTLVVVTLKQDAPYELKWLLGVLNSRLLNYYYFSYLKSTKKVFSEIQARQMAQLPIPKRSSDLRRDTSEGDSALNDCVDRMLAITKQIRTAGLPQERNLLAREQAALDARIDRLVYDLYGLTDDEIALVEESFPPR